MHNEFQGNNFDMALLKLNETVIYNAAIRPVCFPEDVGKSKNEIKLIFFKFMHFHISDQSYRGWQGVIMGWGSIGGTAKSNTLQSATVPIVGNTACKTAWSALNVEVRDSMICAGDGSAAQCTVSHYLNLQFFVLVSDETTLIFRLCAL